MRPAETTTSRENEKKPGLDEAQVSTADKSACKADETAWISGLDEAQGWGAYNQVWTPDPYAWISDFDHIAQDLGTNDHVLTADDEAWKSRSSQDWW